MKQIVILLFLVFSISGYSQVTKTWDLGNVSGSDTTYWYRVETSTPIDIIWDFTDLNANDATVELFYGDITDDGTDTIPTNIEKSATTNPRYPLTLDKTDATYRDIIGSDTTNTFGVSKDNWLQELIGIKLTLNSVTDGNFIQRIEK